MATQETKEIKGWNEDYIQNKFNYYYDIAKKCKNPILKKQYKEQLEIYISLYQKLLLQDGKIFYNKITTKTFLQKYNDLENYFLFDRNTTKTLNNIAQQFCSLGRTPKFDYTEKITHTEAREIIELFLKENFPQENVDNFKDFFRYKKDFILYDKHNEESSVTVTNEGELFVVLPSCENILMLAETAHEAGHIYGLSLNPNPSQTYLNPLREFDSLSYEIRLIDWLIKNNIYEKDASKYLLNMMRIIENVIITRYYNNIYKLNKIKSVEKFTTRIEDLKLMKTLNIKRKQDLFNFIVSSLTNNYIPYLYSFLIVLNNLNLPNYLENYNYALENLTKKDSDIIAESIFPHDITDLTQYKEYRKSLIKNC